LLLHTDNLKGEILRLPAAITPFERRRDAI
jgi:hypothetical protein